MLETIGLCFGALGLAVGLYQTVSARKAKKVHRDSCRTRCRDASNKTLRLGNYLVGLCNVLTRSEVMQPLVQKPSTARHFAALHSSLGATIDVAQDLVRFCERLDEDHRYQFAEDAIPKEEIEELKKIRSCLIEIERSSELRESSGVRNRGEAA